MNTYQRIFGAGLRGLLITAALFALAGILEPVAGLPAITANHSVRQLVFSISIVGAIAVAIWSFKSLPPDARGKKLVTTGVFRYLRHPLYASFLSCSNFGLAVLLNNWIYIIWAVLIHVIWHWNIQAEEKLMMEEFPGKYEEYCRITGRFIPRLRR